MRAIVHWLIRCSQTAHAGFWHRKSGPACNMPDPSHVKKLPTLLSMQNSARMFSVATDVQIK